MRAAPALSLTLTRFCAWRIALVVLVVADAACLAGWGMSRPQALPAAAQIALAGVALASILIAWSARGRPVTLAWDGQAWHLGPPQAGPDRLVRGRLRLRIDLGGWMLLQFVPEGASTMRGTWLPLRCADLVSQWHALRCAACAPAARDAALTAHPRSGS